ncbi:DUF2334 domain-containing protein [Haloarcula laminariae]|uniref:DUF2334 domain-containing protein n=1 Tax=Haloarcula laminariae TaxID=2961577 RepID=UPI00240646B6|nr:DUF2334 domain-containing protein [Halomicroarcula sp. FL173]
MKFCIRDDDTCYYTEPAVLESVFGDIWDDVPVTLACVPMASPDTDALVEATESVPMPIEANAPLRSYLEERVAAGNVEIALHGYHHDTPEGRPEFVTGSGLAGKVRAGRRQLERAFGTTVRLFVPPHVRLSNSGLRAVYTAGLDIVRGYGPRPRETQPDPRWWLGYAHLLAFYARHRKEFRYPTPLNYGTHRELYSHRLNGQTDMAWCKRAFDYIDARNGVFCLSLHASGLGETGRQKLREIVTYARDRNAEFVTASEALETA